MSIRFNGNSANFLSRTTSLPDYNSTYTIMAWVKIKTDTNARATFFNLGIGTSPDFDIGQFSADGTTLEVAPRIGGSGGSDQGTSLSVDAWRHITMRRASVSDLSLFLDAVLDAGPVTSNMTGRTAQNAMEIGRTHVNNFTGEPLDAEMAYLRIWTTDLTTGEISAERDSATAVKTASLYGDYPLATGASAGDDISGQSHPFTINGTITTGASEPPISGFVVQNATHAHTATNIDIDTGVHNLVVQNASHSHAAENVSFGGSGTLFDDCTAAYKLSDLIDATGRGNDLTNNNSATFNTGKLGNAVYLTAASSQSLSRASNADVQTGNTDWTVAGWFWRGADATGSIVSKFNDSSGNREFSVEYNTNDSLRFSVWNAGASEFRATWGSSLALSTWHCFIAWHNAATDTIFLQVNNGTPVSTSTSGSIQGAGTAPFIIGARDVSGSERYFDGRIDNINVLKRVWSSDERTEFWNAGNGVEFSASQSSPMASAGLDQVRMELETVMLDGSQSRDADGGAGITRSWTQVSGPAVTINNATSINPTFLAPDVASPTDLVFKLTVQNQFSLTDEDLVTINVVPTGSTTWLWYTPQEAGFDPDEFYDALAQLPEPSLVLRNGRVVGTRGDVTLEGLIWSASKSLVALMFARQLQLANVDYTDTVPGSDNPSAPLATFAQMMAMTSDFSLSPHSPGDHFAYNNGAVHHYGTHLKTTFYAGQTHVQALQNAYVTALNFEDTLTYNTSGFMSGWDGGWSMSTRDLARICQLVLQNGEWDAVQLLDSDFIDQLYTCQIPEAATQNTDADDQFFNETNGINPTSRLPGAYSFGFWLTRETDIMTAPSMNEALGMVGAFGTSAYISRAKQLIVLAGNVGGTTVNTQEIWITGPQFDLFADALPEQRASSRLTRGSLHGFFDDEELNRTEFPLVTAPDHVLVTQDSLHTHTSGNLALTQAHSLTVQDSAHTHTAQNVVLFFTARASSRLHRGAMFQFYDDEELNRTEFWASIAFTDLTVQNAAHSHSAESFTLTQAHALSVQNASHAHTAENPALTQVHSLAVADANHTHAATSTTLTQDHQLATQSAIHAQTADNLLLDIAVSLVVNDSAHTHSIAQVTLTQVHGIVMHDGLHEHAVESPTLTQSHVLALQDATHAQSATNLQLTQLHELVTQNSVHEHITQNVILTQVHLLTIENSTHAHAAPSLTLTQAHALTLQDAAHGHNAESPTLHVTSTLSVTNGAHDHLAGSPTLAQVHAIVVNDAIHAQQSDSLALTQSHQLVVQSAVHSHAAESPAISTEGALGITSAAHSHTAANITLTQVHALAVDSTSHNQLAESPALVLNLSLTVQDAAHAHSAGSLALAQQHALATQGSTHSHSAQSFALAQSYSLAIQSTVHAHVAQAISFQRSHTPPRRTFMVESTQRTTFVKREREYLIADTNRTDRAI